MTNLRNEELRIEREEGFKLLTKLASIIVLFTIIAIISVSVGLYYDYYRTGKDLLYFIGNALFIYLPEFIILYFVGNYLYQKERKRTITTIKRRKRILKICNTDLELK